MNYKILINYVFVIMLSLFMFVPSLKVDAQTVREYRNYLEKLEADAKNVDSRIKYTDQQIKQAKSDIQQLYKDIDNLIAETNATTKKIAELKTSIADKDKEIKELMSFIQLSNSDSVYMSYIAGAESLTDFIYRVSVSQQLLDYNSDLIDEMNQMIKDSNEKKVLLMRQEEQARQHQQDLYKNVNILGQKKEELYEFDLSLEEEIKLAKMTLQMYINAGCKENDDIKICANKYLPPDTKFWRPLEKGYITSEYGWRYHPISKRYSFHDGIDMINWSNRYNTMVYAAANGKVATVNYDNSRGNYIVLHHNINYKKYTTTYLHLKSGSIRVKVGDNVTKNTILATMGTTGSSTGEHLHFSIATGLWTTDYVSYTTFVDRTVNPRDYVNFTSGYYNYWYDRVKKYN